MKKIAMLSLIFIFFLLSACQSEQNTVDVSNSVSPAGDGEKSVTTGDATLFSINEIGLGENGFVALTNYTDVPASLDGLYLCQGRDCFKLPDVVVDPETTVRIAVGNGTGLENVVATHATIGELRPFDGEVALFNSNDFDDPQEIAVYFQWGAPLHQLTQMAIDAGLWLEGGYGPSGENATRLYRDLDTGLWLWEWE